MWTYDEHGGYYDHVAPPRAVPPDDIPPKLGPNDIPGGYDIYGPRVPAVVVSPYSHPHAVTMVDDIEAAPVTLLGPKVEAHESFPNRTNVEFCKVDGPDVLSVRFWERGVGVTLASGSGSTGTGVAPTLLTASQVAI